MTATITTTAEHDLADNAAEGSGRATLGMTAVTGLLLFLVSLGTWSAEGAPSPGHATAAQIRAFAADHDATIRLNTLSALVSVALFAFFVVGLAQLAGQARKNSPIPGVIVLCGAVATTQTLLIVASASIFAFPHEVDGLADRNIVNLFTLTAVTEWFASLTLASVCMILVGAFSYAALRSRIVARWVSWVGFALAAAGAAQVAAIGTRAELPSGSFLFVIFGWWLWPLAIGGALGVRWLRTRPRRA
jgi:hypothetical protein